jgi:hypothetical protein
MAVGHHVVRAGDRRRAGFAGILLVRARRPVTRSAVMPARPSSPAHQCSTLQHLSKAAADPASALRCRRGNAARAARVRTASRLPAARRGRRSAVGDVAGSTSTSIAPRDVVESATFAQRLAKSAPAGVGTPRDARRFPTDLTSRNLELAIFLDPARVRMLGCTR